MPLASLDDIRTWLPADKFQVTDGNLDLQLAQVDAERLIKGYLRAVFSPSTVAAWADPSTTPAYLRSVAGRLVAAFYYSKKTSEDIPDWVGTYPQRLYDEAMRMLENVKNGDVVLAEVSEIPGTEFTNAFFYPTSRDGQPSFTMSMQW